MMMKVFLTVVVYGKHATLKNACSYIDGWLVVFYILSTARSFRDGTPFYCTLRRT